MAYFMVGKTLIAVLCLSFGMRAFAQTAAIATPQTNAELLTQNHHLEKSFFRDLARDQKHIWTSPFRVRAKDLKWILPLAATTAILIPTDRHVTSAVREEALEHPNQITASRWVSRVGSPEMTFGLAGGMYAIGYFAHDDKLRETGLLSASALVHSSIVVSALKFATNRQRPEQGDGRGRFWTGGRSFPSGHAGTSFALATVIAHEYRDKPLIRWGAYGVAAAISASRVSSLKHHPSDIVIGSALGYLIGRYVVREHASPEASGVKTTVFPYIQPSTNARGIGLMLSF
jgi:membrane-associated phospholipid phosphatase